MCAGVEAPPQRALRGGQVEAAGGGSLGYIGISLPLWSPSTLNLLQTALTSVSLLTFASKAVRTLEYLFLNCF